MTAGREARTQGEGSAGGKVILFGEHAVVYGVPAIAAGIDRGATAIATPDASGALAIGNTRARRGDASDLGRAFDALLSELDARDVGARVEVTLPPGCGLGASAAIGVAVGRAALDLIAPTADAAAAQDDGQRRAAVLRAAQAWERVFHGNPSGIDTAAAAEGGCIWFERDVGATPLAVGLPLQLAIGVAGPPASTKAMVESVARLAERRPTVMAKAMEGVRSLVNNARLCIEAGDAVGLGKLMDLNQMLLAGLHVSSEEIERACGIARESGALGAKLTGAGGGGAVIALTDGSPERVLAAWREAGIQGFAARVVAGAGSTGRSP